MCLIVTHYLQDVVQNPPVQNIVKFYLSARSEANTTLTDGANQRPRYSLRTLVRMLEYCKSSSKMFGFQRALYEGIYLIIFFPLKALYLFLFCDSIFIYKLGACMSFLTLLDGASVPIMNRLIQSHLIQNISKKILEKPPVFPGEGYVQFEQFWLQQGPEEVICDDKYILTHSIKAQLLNLARIVLSNKYPVLLQGPTSSGKVCLIVIHFSHFFHYKNLNFVLTQ